MDSGLDERQSEICNSQQLPWDGTGLEVNLHFAKSLSIMIVYERFYQNFATIRHVF